MHWPGPCNNKVLTQMLWKVADPTERHWFSKGKMSSKVFLSSYICPKLFIYNWNLILAVNLRLFFLLSMLDLQDAFLNQTLKYIHSMTFLPFQNKSHLRQKCSHYSSACDAFWSISFQSAISNDFFRFSFPSQSLYENLGHFCPLLL